MERERADGALAPSQRMRVAYVLTLAGGYLDAYTYFERGGVFANAQTGNIVKLGIALANGVRDTYLFFLLPIGAFALDLATALAIRDQLERRDIRLRRVRGHARLRCPRPPCRVAHRRTARRRHRHHHRPAPAQPARVGRCAKQVTSK